MFCVYVWFTGLFDLIWFDLGLPVMMRLGLIVNLDFCVNGLF